jgi:EAL and modified HD-GYP domain-containing signal transduction protein
MIDRSAGHTPVTDTTQDRPVDLFVAAQPIFDRQTRIYGHELLFRSGPENYFPQGVDPDRATSSVISTGFGLIGLQALTGSGMAFVNVTRTLLVEDFAFILPPRRTVVEILETVEPDTDVLAACARLKRGGYLLALDDFVDKPESRELLPFADFVKVDLLHTSESARRSIAGHLRQKGIRLIAEKVETREDADAASASGYKFVQGYFFSRPVMVASKDVPGFRLNYLRLLRELNRPTLDFDEVESIVSQELAISYRVLRAINSAAFGLRSEVRSIRQALVLLGPERMRMWASVWGLAGLGQDRPTELLVSSVRRARFCELLGPTATPDAPSDELFLLGLFSSIDAIVGRPQEEILADLALSPPVADALLGGDSPLGRLVRCATAMERGAWPEAQDHAKALGVTEEMVAKCHVEASAFAHSAFDPGRATARRPR